MSAAKYLFLYRTPADAPAEPPSPAELQQMFAQWTAWKERFGSEIVDVGDGLKPGGKVVRSATISDGPLIEAKEVMGGYSIVAAADLARAVEISRGCPILLIPGASIEIRELAGY